MADGRSPRRRSPIPSGAHGHVVTGSIAGSSHLDRARVGGTLPETMATNVHLGGFNLYYGMVGGTAHKWLDIGALCDRLLPQDQIKRIRYFTAKGAGTPRDPQAPQRQEVYLRALGTVGDLTIHLGNFHQNTVRMPWPIRRRVARRRLR